MKRTMALDQASRTTGWAIYDNKQLIANGHFSIPVNKTIQQRLVSFVTNLYDLITKYHVEKIYYEGIQYQNNIETYKKLAYIQAMIIYNTATNNIPIVELSPSHWRSVIKEKHGIKFGRSRAEQKQKAQEFVNDFFNIKTTEDEADAICLGYAGILEDEKKESAW